MSVSGRWCRRDEAEVLKLHPTAPCIASCWPTSQGRKHCRTQQNLAVEANNALHKWDKVCYPRLPWYNLQHDTQSLIILQNWTVFLTKKTWGIPHKCIQQTGIVVDPIWPATPSLRQIEWPQWIHSKWQQCIEYGDSSKQQNTGPNHIMLQCQIVNWY